MNWIDRENFKLDKKEYDKKHYKNNKDKTLAQHKIWLENNPRYDKEYYQTNKEKRLEQNKEWRKNNPEYWKKYWDIDPQRKLRYQIKYEQFHKKERNEYARQYRKNNMLKIIMHNNKYQKDKRKTDYKFNLNCRMSSAINIALKNNKNDKHWETLVGYTLDNLIKRLQKTILDGYTWQDFLKGKLQVDHIIPKSVFNYTKPEDYDFKKCWSLNNLRLLPKEENLRKSNKLYSPFQPALCIESY